MPIYEFMCEKCLKVTEELLTIYSKKQLTKCKFCEEVRAKRIVSEPSGYCMNGYSYKNGYSKGEK
ncbi:MAG: FmdB family zinc ribbon protein [Promethearchaeota archaeon]|jgi:putative FmdB family regulatory protein